MSARNLCRASCALSVITLIVIIAALIFSGFGSPAAAISPTETSTPVVPTQPPPKVFRQSVISLLTDSLQGPLTVIVMLKGDFRFDVKLSPIEEMNQNIAIKMAQARLIANLAPFNVEIMCIFQTIPELTLKADTQTLVYLLLSPDVATITENFSASFGLPQ